MASANIGRWRKSRVLAALLAAACLLTACNKSAPEASYAPTFVAPGTRSQVVQYSFGVSPMSNFRHIYDVFQPIIEHINGGLADARLVLEVPRGINEHAQQLGARKYAFALSNPYLTWRAAQRHGYRIVAKAGDDDQFHGIFIVRRDSGITALSALAGRHIAFPPRLSMAGTMMNQLQLKDAGIDPESGIKPSYVGSQHASIMAVHAGSVAAGATWPLAWDAFRRLHPAEARLLEPRFPTPSLVQQGIVARDDVPPELVARVSKLLAAMHDSEKGRALLAAVPLRRFELAGDAQYDVVRTFMARYAQAFPKVHD